jgi:hypothetical protein
MIKKSKRTETKEVEDVTYICDRCGKAAKRGNYTPALRECCICGRWICRSCAIGFDSLEYEGYAYDRPYYRACRECLDAGDYRQRIKEAQENADMIKAAVLKEWRMASKVKNFARE